MTMTTDDTFELYNLEITVEGDPDTFVCSHASGLAMTVVGENLIFKQDRFSMYALAALLPLLPVKQRPTHKNDWMTSDENIACPDPNCGGLFRITRTDMTKFSHAETTDVPLPTTEE